MDDQETDREESASAPISAHLRGETMAYAAQNAVYNVAANFFEPWINYRIQKYYSQHHSTHPGSGNYTQNLAGEFAGDIIGASTLILAEALVPEQLHACTRKIRSWVDPLYTSVAHRVFADERKTPDYDQKVAAWKTFQERNLARSSIIATAGVLGNVATQKLLIGNPAPTKLIFAGKLLSTALTTSIVLGARLALPSQTKGMDRWMSKNIFAPMLQDRNANGNGESRSGSHSHVDKLSDRKDEPEFSAAR